MTKPFFSIITCTYNSEKTLLRTINSIKSQKFTDYEHIIIDGNSTDYTSMILKKYQKLNPKTVKIFSYPPQGVSHAMNQGIRQSSGVYLIHLHSDDYFYSSKVLSKAHDFLKSHRYDWVYGKINAFKEPDQNIGLFPNRKIFQTASAWLLAIFNYVPHQAVFIKKEIFEKFGLFDEKLKITMDYEYWLRISRQTHWCFVDLIVSNYSVSPTSISANTANDQRISTEYDTIHHKYLRFPLYSLSVISKIITNFVSKSYR